MTLHLAQENSRAKCAGFTLIEILIAFLIFGMAISGLIYGYVQANRMAELSSMSLAAQSLAEQGLEQARSAQWDSQMWPMTNGPGTADEMSLFDNSGRSDADLGFVTTQGHTNFAKSGSDYILDVPTTGAPVYVTNYITVTNIYASGVVPLRQIRSDVVWTFPLDGALATNTVIMQRAPDE